MDLMVSAMGSGSRGLGREVWVPDLAMLLDCVHR